MNYLKISIGIFAILAFSRFVPHPPNFTSLIALSFYVPIIFGSRFIPSVILSLLLTDLFFGFHSTLFFTWGSVFIIGIISKYFYNSLITRLKGSLLGATIFFVATNFGVWLSGYYEYTLGGLLNCYILAIPFFGYTLISTLTFSIIIETLYKFYKIKVKRKVY
jgi:hypothetical protein